MAWTAWAVPPGMRNLVRKTRLSRLPPCCLAKLASRSQSLFQRTPFLHYVIQQNETVVTGSIASSCVQLPGAPSSVVLLRLALRLSVAFGLWNGIIYNVNTISQMQLAANSIRSYTRKLNSYYIIVPLSSCSIRSAEKEIKIFYKNSKNVGMA